MKVLFVPDSLWGDGSGHRSSKYLIRAFRSINVDIAVYTPVLNYSKEQHDIINDSDCKFYPRTEYGYSQQVFRKEVDREFMLVVDEYKPDYVFYVGTIKNKTSIDLCIKNNIKYLYLPLTTEYYCVNTFAGLENGPCFGCLQGSLTAPFKKKCLPDNYKLASYIKDKTIEAMSKKRIINAHRIVGYSDDQLSILESFGVDKEKTLKLPIFFDPNSADGIEISAGDRFLVFGQFLTAKGWHLIPEIIKRTKNVKFKVILKESNFDKFIKGNDLEQYIESGALKVVDFLETHEMLLEEVARSKGVLIPSYYPTTGEFSMLESLMFSKPVIVFDSGIHKEIFIDKENGMIAKVGDLDAYCEKVEELNNNEELHRTVSIGAEKLFQKLTSLEMFRFEFLRNL
jgi:glycosyltransferase involved in cell wall biosynthesis